MRSVYPHYLCGKHGVATSQQKKRKIERTRKVQAFELITNSYFYDRFWRASEEIMLLLVIFNNESVTKINPQILTGP